MKTDVIVMSPLTTEAILGVHFVLKYEAHIDLPTQCLIPSDQEMSLPLQIFQKTLPSVTSVRVHGMVKWFTVKNRYGFITKSDMSEDIFVHQIAITKNNLWKYLCGVGDGKMVELIVIQGAKGSGAA